VKPPDFDYAKPASVAEAVQQLAGDPEAKVLAGGQSLIPLLAFRLAHPTTLIDLAGIEELAQVEQRNGTVAVGSMVRQRHAEHDDVLAEHCPLLVDALAHVAHPQIRSRGTLGGSVAHADPAAEVPAVLAALDGRVRVAGPAGEREIEAAELFLGFLTTSLAADEILVALELPVAPPRTGTACVEIVQRPGDYAIAGAVCQVSVDTAGAPIDARLCLIGVSDRPHRAGSAEEALLSGAGPAEAGALARDGLDPPDDTQGSAEYRAHLATVVAERAFEQALEKVA